MESRLKHLQNNQLPLLHFIFPIQDLQTNGNILNLRPFTYYLRFNARNSTGVSKCYTLVTEETPAAVLKVLQIKYFKLKPF